MQERLQRAEARAARAEDRQTQELELQAKLSNAEVQVQAWEAAGAGVGVDSPGGVAEKLRDMQNECLALSEQLGDSSSEARKLRGKLDQKNSSCCHGYGKIYGPENAIGFLKVYKY